MAEKVLEKECSFERVLGADVTALRVKLGWDEKEATLAERIKGHLQEAATGISAASFDLNLAAILEYADGTKPELVFHHGAGGCGKDEAGSVLLSHDDRTGAGAGSDETLQIHLADVPEAVERIVLFVNISSANLVHQRLADVPNVFVQIESEDDCAVLFREEDAFKSEDATAYCCYTFAAVCRTESGWVLRGMARYSCEDCEQDTMTAITAR